MRVHVHVHGPGIGPVHTTLWSSGRRRTRTPHRGWIRAYFIACALTGWAFAIAGPLGWLAIILFFILPVTVIVLRRRSRRQRAPGRSMPDDGRDTGWKAEHVPASAEYKKAHPEGPRDWEPAAS